MRDRINRILDLVREGRLGHDDATQLLEALSPKLSLSVEARPHVFGLLDAPDFGVDRVTELLEMRAFGGRNPRVVISGKGVSGIEDIGRHINTVVETALDGAFGQGGGRSRRAGTLLRITVEDSDGSELRANLPLSLAEHTAKLLPPRVLSVLERQGITSEALTTMLQANPPVGELLSLEAADGAEINLTIA